MDFDPRTKRATYKPTIQPTAIPSNPLAGLPSADELPAKTTVRRMNSISPIGGMPAMVSKNREINASLVVSALSAATKHNEKSS